MIFYSGQFPCLVRLPAEVWPPESTWRASHAAQARNFYFNRLGKRVVYRLRGRRGEKCGFLIRVSVWR